MKHKAQEKEGEDILSNHYLQFFICNTQYSLRLNQENNPLCFSSKSVNMLMEQRHNICYLNIATGNFYL